MKQLLVHSLVVAPIVNWITSPSRRWSRRVGINIAITVLILIALLQVKRMEYNCFELVGVDKSASGSEISKAFRRQSINYHPDRPQKPDSLPFGFSTSSDVFIELQKCYETISNEEKLSVYNRFGDMKLNFSNQAQMYPVMAVFSFLSYVIHFIVCATLTSGPETKASMYWIAGFLLFAFSSEMYLKFLGQEELFGLVPFVGTKWLVFEQVEALKDLVPSVLSSGLLLSRLMYTNDSDMFDSIVGAVHRSNKEVAEAVVKSRTPAGGGGSDLVPAILSLGGKGIIAKAPPSVGSTGGLDSTPPNAVAPVPQGQNLFQRMMSWLFFAYLAKSLYNAIRDLM